MSVKIGQVYKITNRYIEIIHNEDIFSKPITSDNNLLIAGMLNSYVSIPLYNSCKAIGIIIEQFYPTKEREVLFNSKEEAIVSKVRIIGMYNPINETFKRGIDYFPTIDSEVFIIEEKELNNIYNSTIDSKEPYLVIGNDIFYKNINILTDPNILLGKHCAILGNTGSGKSCTVTSILQGIYTHSERLKNANTKNLKTIIIDSNEEYSDIFNTDTAEKKWLDIKSYENLELSHQDLSFYEITQLLQEDSPNVIPYLKEAIKKLKKDEDVDAKIYYDFSALENAIIEAVPMVDKMGRLVKDTFTIGFLKHIIKRINHFCADNRFKAVFGTDKNSIIEFLDSKEKRVLILSLKVPNDVLALFVYMISKSIFNFKTKDKTQANILLVLEEAHRYIAKDSVDQLNNYYIEKLAKEGRKFGVNLMVSTQRPSEISNTVMSQCNSMIVHKITNIRDIEYIRNTIEYEDKSQIDLLSSLKQQQALVLGEAFAFSSLVKISDAKPLPDSETPQIFKLEI